MDLALVEETISSDVDTGRQVMLRDATRRLYAALERIEGPASASRLALAAVDGRSLAEVAELTDSTVIAVKTRVLARP